MSKAEKNLEAHCLKLLEKFSTFVHPAFLGLHREILAVESRNKQTHQLSSHA